MKLSELYKECFGNDCIMPDIEFSNSQRNKYCDIYMYRDIEKEKELNTPYCDFVINLYLSEKAVYNFEVSVFMKNDKTNALIKELINKYKKGDSVVYFEFSDNGVNVRKDKKVIDSIERKLFPKDLYMLQFRDEVFACFSGKNLDDLIKASKSLTSL